MSQMIKLSMKGTVDKLHSFGNAKALAGILFGMAAALIIYAVVSKEFEKAILGSILAFGGLVANWGSEQEKKKIISSIAMRSTENEVREYLDSQ